MTWKEIGKLLILQAILKITISLSEAFDKY